MSETGSANDTHLLQIAPEIRARAAHIWGMRAGMELAVSAGYTIIVRELFETGGERAVVEMCGSAIAEEIQHAQLCLDVAEAFDGRRRPWPHPWSLHVPAYFGITQGPTLTALHLVAMSCLNESIACVRLAEAINLTKSAVARNALHRILRDEIRHARAGWAHLAGAHVTREMKVTIGQLLPHLVASSLRGLIEENASIPIDDLATLGLPSVETARMHAVKALMEVVLPGFLRLEVPFDDAAVRRHLV